MYSLHVLFTLIVYKRLCNSAECSGEIFVDGDSYCLINIANQLFIAHEVYRRFMISFGHGR